MNNSVLRNIEYGYPVFIAINLAIELGIIDKDGPYDIQWAKGVQLYREFIPSPYNSFTLSEYTCIEAFLKARKARVEASF